VRIGSAVMPLTIKPAMKKTVQPRTGRSGSSMHAFSDAAFRRW
jgi:hypothetical protein